VGRRFRIYGRTITEADITTSISKVCDMKKWQCFFCSFIYDEALGLPDDGIPAGTAWQDVPEDWLCPECGAAKEDFAMVEMA